MVESRKDCVVFTSDELKENVTVIGYPKVKLYVSSDCVDTDFAIRLFDVYPDGKSMLITDGIHRMRYRDSLEEPMLMKPGDTYSVTVKLDPTAQTFLKGHRIRIIVSSSDYPRFERNPNNGKEKFNPDTCKTATNKVIFDKSHQSLLSLPIVSQDETKDK